MWIELLTQKELSSFKHSKQVTLTGTFFWRFLEKKIILFWYKSWIVIMDGQLERWLLTFPFWCNICLVACSEAQHCFNELFKEMCHSVKSYGVYQSPLLLIFAFCIAMNEFCRRSALNASPLWLNWKHLNPQWCKIS